MMDVRIHQCWLLMALAPEPMHRWQFSLNWYELTDPHRLDIRYKLAGNVARHSAAFCFRFSHYKHWPLFDATLPSAVCRKPRLVLWKPSWSERRFCSSSSHSQRSLTRVADKMLGFIDIKATAVYGLDQAVFFHLALFQLFSNKADHLDRYKDGWRVGTLSVIQCTYKPMRKWLRKLWFGMWRSWGQNSHFSLKYRRSTSESQSNKLDDKGTTSFIIWAGWHFSPACWGYTTCDLPVLIHSSIYFLILNLFS